MNAEEIVRQIARDSEPVTLAWDGPRCRYCRFVLPMASSDTVQQVMAAWRDSGFHAQNCTWIHSRCVAAPEVVWAGR